MILNHEMRKCLKLRFYLILKPLKIFIFIIKYFEMHSYLTYVDFKQKRFKMFDVINELSY